MTTEATTSGFLLAGFLVVDTRRMIIIQVACGAMGMILFTLIAIKGKPTIHTAITTTTNIHIAIPIGIRTITTAMTCGLGK
jgi:hypothetical protein